MATLLLSHTARVGDTVGGGVEEEEGSEGKEGKE